MDDRALLEAAAKAGGIELVDPLKFALDGIGLLTLRGVGDRTWWNPLTDDGDALRLAVKLRLNVFVGRGGTAIQDGEIPLRGTPSAVESHGADPYSATRRAITRCAASMGEGK